MIVHKCSKSFSTGLQINFEIAYIELFPVLAWGLGQQKSCSTVLRKKEMKIFGQKTSDFELGLIEVASRVLDETRHFHVQASLELAVCEMVSSCGGKIQGSNFEEMCDVRS